MNNYIEKGKLMSQGTYPVPFRFSTPNKERLGGVSKWLNIQVLLDAHEMEELFNELPPCYLLPVGRVIRKDKFNIAKEEFLDSYAKYIQALKDGEELPSREFHGIFSCALSTSFDDFYALDVDEEKMLLKAQRPIIQMQPHSLGFSEVDEEIHPMVRGRESIAWGVQFSYPQIFQEGHTDQIHEVMKEEGFGNTQLFLTIQRWLRHHSRPTPFLIRDKQVKVSIRIGNHAFSWINNHHQLRMLGIIVDVDREEA
jgi:hypothetical protein